MCGRFLLYSDEEYKEIEDIINEIQGNLENLKRGEIFPTDYVPVIYYDNNIKCTSLLKWGFPNYRQSKGVLINARGETIGEKPTFKNLIYSNRCLIPSNGFYEWKRHNTSKEKYLIRPENQKLFFMAGLYNSFRDMAGNIYKGFVVITTQSNNDMTDIHDRMPVIIDSKEAASEWIDNSMVDFSHINAYIQPYKYRLEIQKVKQMNEQLAFNI